jgi:hypothetical protein
MYLLYCLAGTSPGLRWMAGPTGELRCPTIYVLQAALQPYVSSTGTGRQLQLLLLSHNHKLCTAAVTCDKQLLSKVSPAATSDMSSSQKTAFLCLN